jgi:prevent-host-death family protein
MVIGDDHMGTNEVAIGEGKREFTRIVKKVSEESKDVIITQRGNPVAVLIPYEEYKEISGPRSYLRMLRISKNLEKYGITASRIHEENRKELEGG